LNGLQGAKQQVKAYAASSNASVSNLLGAIKGQKAQIQQQISDNQSKLYSASSAASDSSS